MIWGWRYGTPTERHDITEAMRSEVRTAASQLGARSETDVRVTLELFEAACRAELEALEGSPRETAG